MEPIEPIRTFNTESGPINGIMKSSIDLVELNDKDWALNEHSWLIRKSSSPA